MDKSEYELLFQTLNVNRHHGKIAPHKAILLISVIELIQSGHIERPFIPIDRTLENTFRSVWNRYVSQSSRFQCSLNYPFYHMSSSPFWTLVRLPEYEEKKDYSMATLKKSFAGATIPGELYAMLKDPTMANHFKNILINAFLDDNSHNPAALTALIPLFISLLMVA